MGRTVAIGIQSYSELIENNCFYVDKTSFIKEWWESMDKVTLITRPRRFGKTLTMSMVEQFFSIKYAERSDLFEKQSIWREDGYHNLQGNYPVLSLSFANVKETDYDTAVYRICQLLKKLYEQNAFLRTCEQLSDAEKIYFERMTLEMDEKDAPLALYQLSDFLCRYYGKKVIILLDEYDTPIQEAYVAGYWEKLTDFIRSLFNSTFKTNPWLERAILTGITRISKESIFSDLNNLEVVTTITNKYEESFGFTEDEVFEAMEEYGYTNKAEVKEWYDGFTFGKKCDIYNPWSVLNFLDKGELDTYWTNTSSNSLINKLIREGNSEIKMTMEDLLQGIPFHTQIDEQIVFNQLNQKISAIWSLLLACGYLKVVNYKRNPKNGKPEYNLELTNKEVHLMFEEMINGWFADYTSAYNKFIKALLRDDVEEMNEYMNAVARKTFSSFDTGKHPSDYAEPERFYHGFVLGLMIDLQDRYRITFNRESGFGRYDVVLTPFSDSDDAMIMEFKVYHPKKEKNLEETLQNALRQIESKQYDTDLLAQGIAAERIRKYGFAFEGKNVLIG